VNKEDIKVAINGNQVTLTAEVKEENDAGSSSSGTLRSERYYGQLYRSFTLPQEVDDDQAQARYENGVLQLTLPKKTGGGGKQLQIQ
jgi:HSP20 family protein